MDAGWKTTESVTEKIGHVQSVVEASHSHTKFSDVHSPLTSSDEVKLIPFVNEILRIYLASFFIQTVRNDGKQRTPPF